MPCYVLSMLKWVAAAALVLAVVLSGRRALGDAESDRASLKREINDKVRRIAVKDLLRLTRT